MNLTAIFNSTRAAVTGAFAISTSSSRPSFPSTARSSSSATAAGTAQNRAATSTTAAASAPASQLDAIQKRVQADADSTKAQLSALGALKSAVSQSQIAAQAASKLGSNATATDITNAMGSLFNGYNGVVLASQKASQTNAQQNLQAGAQPDANARSAGRVGKDFQWALSGTAPTDALKKLGLSVKADGTLVQDAAKFAAAVTADSTGVRAALGTLGLAIDKTAGKELNPAGTLGAAEGRLNQRSAALSAQQKALSSAAQSLAAYRANS